MSCRETTNKPAEHKRLIRITALLRRTAYACLTPEEMPQVEYWEGIRHYYVRMKALQPV